jgi:transposase InsO family protein
MPWKETSVLNERVRFVTLVTTGNRSFSSICEELGISRTCGYRWMARYRAANSFTALVDQSRAPLSSPNKTPEQIESRVIALRQQYGWGAKKLFILLAQEGIDLSIATINRILQRKGLMRREDSHQPALRRFERPEPNELWQIDYKGRLHASDGYCYPFSILDDYSRFSVGLYPLRAPDASGTYACLVDAMKKYGTPKAMLMDHGTPWWNAQASDGLGWLSIQLIKQDIDLYFSGFRHPQTQGKVEAFHRTLSRDLNHHGHPDSLEQITEHLERFRSEYNQVRPHEGIGMVVPAQRYQPSPRPYADQPPEWQYDDGLYVTTLNSEGSITYGGRRYFVSKPLANERVAAQLVNDKLLVQYRNEFIREIDLRTGTTAPFSQPVRDNVYIGS